MPTTTTTLVVETITAPYCWAEVTAPMQDLDAALAAHEAECETCQREIALLERV